MCALLSRSDSSPGEWRALPKLLKLISSSLLCLVRYLRLGAITFGEFVTTRQASFRQMFELF